MCEIGTNAAGQVFDPLNEVDDLQEWSDVTAYQVKVETDAAITFTGDSLSPDTEYELNAGWNWLVYPRTDTLHPLDAFNRFAEQIILVKEGTGLFLLPESGTNTVGWIDPGAGGMVEAVEAFTFRWHGPSGEFDPPPDPQAPTEHFAHGINTGRNMTVIVADWNDLDPQPGDEIALVDTSGAVMSASVVGGDITFIVAWGDDDTTPEERDGFAEGEAFRVVFWSAEADSEIVVLAETADREDELTYSENRLLFLNLSLPELGVPDGDDTNAPFDFRLISVYPNPFNSTAEIVFSLNRREQVDVSLLDMKGRQIATLSSGFHSAGEHRVVLNAGDLPAGMYLVGLDTPVARSFKRIILLR